MRYRQSFVFFTNTARTEFSCKYNHLFCGDSSLRSKRSKHPGCHFDGAFSSCRIHRLRAAEQSLTFALRSLTGVAMKNGDDPASALPQECSTVPASLLRCEAP